MLSQVPPGRTQTPQLALQQTSPTLHVVGPHRLLDGIAGMPQMNCEQSSPGFAQRPQLGLQQTLPGPHVVEPHATISGAAEAEGAGAVGAADALVVGFGATLAEAAGALTSTVGSTCSTIGWGRRAASASSSSASARGASRGTGAGDGAAAVAGTVLTGRAMTGKGAVLRGGSGSAPTSADQPCQER